MHMIAVSVTCCKCPLVMTSLKCQGTHDNLLLSCFLIIIMDSKVKVSFPGRNPLLGGIYTISDHPQVPKPHGKIYLILQDMSEPGMQALLELASNMSIPKNRAALK